MSKSFWNGFIKHKKMPESSMRQVHINSNNYYLHHLIKRVSNILVDLIKYNLSILEKEDLKSKILKYVIYN